MRAAAWISRPERTLEMFIRDSLEGVLLVSDASHGVLGNDRLQDDIKVEIAQAVEVQMCIRDKACRPQAGSTSGRAGRQRQERKAAAVRLSLIHI